MLCRIRHKITISEFPVAFERKKCYSIARRQKAVADIAQSVERILGKDEVPSSNLGISSRQVLNTSSGLFLIHRVTEACKKQHPDADAAVYRSDGRGRIR